MQQGLFDFATPDMVGLQVEQENQAYANRPGSMLDKIAGAGSLAALRGSSILGDALGQPDPRKAQAMKVQEALQEIKQSGADLNEDPVGFYKAMAKAFASKGLMQQATQASMKAMEAEEKKEDRQLKRDIGANKLAESQLEVAMAQAKLAKAMQTAKDKPWSAQLFEFIKTGKYTPESLEKYANTGTISDLQLVDKKDTFSDPYNIVVNGKTVRVQKNLITGKEESVGSGGVSTTVSLGESTESKAALSDYEREAKAHSIKFDAAMKMGPYAEELTKLTDTSLNTGSWAEWKTAAKRALNTIGVTKDESVSNDDLFDSYIMQFVLPRMSELGGSDSNEELKALRNMTGDRKWSPETMKKALGIIRREQAKVTKIQEAYEAHIANGGERVNFNFKTGKAFKGSTGASQGSGNRGVPTQPQQGAVEPSRGLPEPPKKPVIDYRAKARQFLAQQTGKEPTEEQVNKWLEKYAPKGN